MAAMAGRAHGLPEPAGSLVGRQEQIDGVVEALAASRLVTLLGTAGTGKTRLAVEVAGKLQRDGRHEAFFVDLAPVRDSALAAQALLAAAGEREDPGRSVAATVADRLAGRDALVVLDNCEHLVDACADLVRDLLSAAPQVRVLATSRVPLEVGAEIRWPVPCLTEAEAAELFGRRARLVDPAFRSDAGSRHLVDELCRRLDCLPLAVELAAARMGQVTVGEILARLDQRLNLLSSGSRDIPARHRTLGAALDWSFDLLDAEERQVLSRLSVFAGGFGSAAAERVAGCTLDSLTHLVDQSLLMTGRGADGRARFRMLESIREYAAQRLRYAGEAAELAERHFRHFAAVAAEAAAELRGPDQVRWLDALEEEHDNIRAALDWGVAHDPEAAIGLAASIVWFWNVHGHFTESVRRLTRLLAASPSASPEVRAAGLAALGRQALNLPGTPGARAALDESLELWRRLEEPKGLAHALMSRALLGIVLREPPELCESLVRETLTAAERCGDGHHQAEATAYLGVIAFRVRHDPAAARPWIVKAAELARDQGDVWLLAFALDFLGAVELALDDAGAAWAHLTEARSLWERLRDPDWISTTNALLGKAALARGDAQESLGYLEAALRSRSQLDARDFALGGPLGIEPMATLAAAEGRYDRAVRLHGAAESLPILALRGEAALEEQPWYGAALAALGRDRLRRVLEEGRRMSQPEAIAYALSASGDAAGDPLTPREREIAALVMRGLRNREIAERLFISQRTVDGHLENIKEKLGVRSRSEVAVWARTQGLG